MVCDYCEQYILNWTGKWVGENQEALLGGVAGGMFAFFILLILILFVAIYVYHALAWVTIAKKRKYKKSWLAWIPFASSAMRLQLGKKFHWAWVFLYLIPILGWIAIGILLIISHWKIFEFLKYPGWFSLAPVVDILPGIAGIGQIAYFVIIGIVAWKKK